MPYVASVNNAVSILHRITDLEGSLYTGSVTGFSAELLDETQASSSAVTWTEPASGGYLTVRVTPDAAGTWLLRLTNPTTYSDGATYDYYIQAVTAVQGLTPSGTWLTTLSNLKEQLGITVTSEDAYLSNLIARASTMIESALGRPVLSATYTEDYDGTGTPWLFLRRGPIQSVTSVVTLDWATGSGVADDTQDPETYRIYGLASTGHKGCGSLKADGWTWTKGNLLWRVTYVAGFSTVPYDLEQLCLDVCVWLRNLRKDSGTVSRDVGAGSTSFRSHAELTDLIERGLAPYRDWRA